MKMGMLFVLLWALLLFVGGLAMAFAGLLLGEMIVPIAVSALLALVITAWIKLNDKLDAMEKKLDKLSDQLDRMEEK